MLLNKISSRSNKRYGGQTCLPKSPDISKAVSDERRAVSVYGPVVVAVEMPSDHMEPCGKG